MGMTVEVLQRAEWPDDMWPLYVHGPDCGDFCEYACDGAWVNGSVELAFLVGRETDDVV